VRDGGSLANLRLTRNAPLAGGAFAAALLGIQKREAECLRALHARIAENRSAWEARSSRTVPPSRVAVDATSGGVDTGVADGRVVLGTRTNRGGATRTMASFSLCIGRGSRAPRACTSLWSTGNGRYWTFGQTCVSRACPSVFV